MATTIDNVRWSIEENPLFEGATAVPATGPNRNSTDIFWLPVQTAQVRPQPSHLDRGDEVRGILGSVPRLIETYDPEGSMAMRCYLNPLTPILQCAGLVGTHTTGDGIITDPDAGLIPATAHRWVFSKRGGITAKTATVTISYVDEAVFLKLTGAGVSQITLNAQGALGIDLMGLVVGRIADPNYTPSFDTQAIVPIRRGDLTLTWLTGTGSTDDFSMTLTNPLVRRRSMSLTPASFFPDKLEHGDEQVALNGSIPKSVLDQDDWDALIAATTFAGKAKWKTPKSILATSYKYTMWVEMASAQIVGGNADEMANRRRFGGSFDWYAAWDETAAYDFKITLVNSVPSIETYV